MSYTPVTLIFRQRTISLQIDKEDLRKTLPFELFITIYLLMKFQANILKAVSYAPRNKKMHGIFQRADNSTKRRRKVISLVLCTFHSSHISFDEFSRQNLAGLWRLAPDSGVADEKMQ